MAWFNINDLGDHRCYFIFSIHFLGYPILTYSMGRGIQNKRDIGPRCMIRCFKNIHMDWGHPVRTWSFTRIYQHAQVLPIYPYLPILNHIYPIKSPGALGFSTPGIFLNSRTNWFHPLQLCSSLGIIRYDGISKIDQKPPAGHDPKDISTWDGYISSNPHVCSRKWPSNRPQLTPNPPNSSCLRRSGAHATRMPGGTGGLWPSHELSTSKRSWASRSTKSLPSTTMGILQLGVCTKTVKPVKTFKFSRHEILGLSDQRSGKLHKASWSFQSLGQVHLWSSQVGPVTFSMGGSWIAVKFEPVRIHVCVFCRIELSLGSWSSVWEWNCHEYLSGYVAKNHGRNPGTQLQTGETAFCIEVLMHMHIDKENIEGMKVTVACSMRSTPWTCLCSVRA